MKIFIVSYVKSKGAIICVSVVISMVLCVNGATASPLCLVGDFDAQVQQLLDSQMLTKNEIANVSTVFNVLEETLSRLWPGSTVIPQGSLYTKLAMKSSDIDCMVLVPNYPIYNVTACTELVMQGEQLLNQQTDLYDNVRARLETHHHIPILTFDFVPTERDCDVTFISNSGMENVQMIAYYYNLDARARNLATIIKIWSEIHRSERLDKLTSYDLNLLTIFYLQQENIAPPFYVLEKVGDGYRPISEWKPSFNNSKSVYELLGGFFKYYSEFNFEEYVVSPVLGRPILKTDFLDIDSLPDELSLYKYNMKKQHKETVDVFPKISVQSIFSQISIEDSSLPTELANKFISDVEFAAKMFDRLPKDRYLRAIVIEDEQQNKVCDQRSLIDDVEELEDY